jgi:hypothetical protein
LNELHCVISQKVELFITTAVRTSNPIHNLFLEARVSLETAPILSLEVLLIQWIRKEIYEVIMLTGSPCVATEL